MHILIVEDDYELAALAGNALQQAGYAVDMCRTVEEACQSLRQERYDLAMVDMYLPDGTGLDLLGFIRAIDGHLPVLMLSARLDLGAKLQASGDRAVGYLRKPLVVGELLARIRTMAGKRLEPAH